MVPRAELEVLLCTVTEAVTLAADGQPAAGRSRILTGLERALSCAASGEPWGAELVDRYRRALANFRHEHPAAH